MRKIDLRAQQFGAWTVLARASSDKHGNAMWSCRCGDCGGTADVRADALKSGTSRSCGCDGGRRVVERTVLSKARADLDRIGEFNRGRPLAAPPKPKPRPNRTTVRRVIIEPVQPKAAPKAEPGDWRAFKERALARVLADMKKRKAELA